MYSFIISSFIDEINENINTHFETLQKIGVRHFEPSYINGKNIADFTDDEIFELLTAMKKYKIRASAIGSSIGKIGIRDDFEPHFEKFKRVVDIAKALGTEYIRIFSFCIPVGQDPEMFRGEVTFRLVKMIMYAKSQNVVLLCENENDTYGDTAERCHNLFDALYSSNFKALFNPAKFDLCGENTKDAFEKLSSYISYMHLNNTDNKNIQYILNSLKEIEYIGFLSIDPTPETLSLIESLGN